MSTSTPLASAAHTYLASLWGYNPKTDNEHTYRTQLENFMAAVCAELQPDVMPRQEVKDGQASLGVPDFSFINPRTLGTVGLLENKKIGLDVEPLVNDKQVKKYTKRNGNIILTNYLDWILVKDGKATHRASLCKPDALAKKPTPDPDELKKLENLLKAFLSSAPKGIGRAKELAEQLAIRCHDLKEYLNEALNAQQQAGTGQRKLLGLYQVFRQSIFEQLTLAEFADAFAQMLGYSLFLAKLNVPTGTTITLVNARQYIPHTFELIRELSSFLEVLQEPEYEGIRYRVEEILGIMNTLYLAELVKDLSFDKRGLFKGTKEADEERLKAADPYLYFYEHFLKEYDAKLRETRGVYYTPPEVVHFIVKSVNQILTEVFGIPRGLADGSGKVSVLDFATGTGTFLLEVLEQIMGAVPENTAIRQGLVRDHVLRNLMGFEFLLAPYTIAHLKLSQFLASKGCPVPDGQRLGVYLTNTLEPAFRDFEKQHALDYIYTAMTDEGRAAQAVKGRQILVITGNPPYSGHSKNPSEREITVTKKQADGTDKLVKKKEKTFIGALMDDYKLVRGAPLGERNPKWLQDDYVKFIRFAQWKMSHVEEGIVAIITNHAWLDNSTFRGMRASLMDSFDQIYVLDLHGNALRKETDPAGGPDGNVFDIMQGVAISFFIKKKGLAKGVFHADLYGKRGVKYDYCTQHSWGDVEWNALQPENPDFMFQVVDKGVEAHYKPWWSLKDIFRDENVGIVTADDKTFLAHDEDQLCQQVQAKFGEWDASKARRCAYRPFDTRTIYYDTERLERPRYEIMQHMLGSPNIAFMTTKKVEKGVFEHAFVYDTLMESHALSMKEINYIFPLYLMPDTSPNADMFARKEKESNLEPAYMAELQQATGLTPTPEDVLGYLYAVLHSPTYRTRYAEFLRKDFPRIPMPASGAAFTAASRLGWGLVQAHLKHQLPKLGLGTFGGTGEAKVAETGYPQYVAETQRLHINAEAWFEQVPPEVADFQIGGYKVLDKYLKYRKDRTLSYEEILHLTEVINILAFTHQQVQIIDNLWECP